jgi:hypothetical protein
MLFVGSFSLTHHVFAMNNPNWYAPPAAAAGSPALASAAQTDPVPRAEYAGFAIRAGARLLDTIAAGIVSAIGTGAATMCLAILQAAHVIDGVWKHLAQSAALSGPTPRSAW